MWSSEERHHQGCFCLSTCCHCGPSLCFTNASDVPPSMACGSFHTSTRAFQISQVVLFPLLSLALMGGVRCECPGCAYAHADMLPTHMHPSIRCQPGQAHPGAVSCAERPAGGETTVPETSTGNASRTAPPSPLSREKSPLPHNFSGNKHNFFCREAALWQGASSLREQEAAPSRTSKKAVRLSSAMQRSVLLDMPPPGCHATRKEVLPAP